MSYILLTGLVFAGVPIILIIGFAAFIFLSFTRDDPDAAAVVRLAYIVMFIGFVLIAAHFLGVSSPSWSGGF